MHKDLLKMLDNFSAVSKAAIDTCSRFQDITAKNTERLIKQQLEMMQLTAGNGSDQVQGIKDITEIVMKNGERMTQQQLDLLKLSIDSSTEFIKESTDSNDIKSALKAQKEFAEGISSSMMDNAQSGLDLCIETQSEIQGIVKDKMQPRLRSKSKPVRVKQKKSRKISGSLANRAKQNKDSE